MIQIGKPYSSYKIFIIAYSYKKYFERKVLNFRSLKLLKQLLLFFRIRPSKEQLAILLEEKTKLMNKKISWDKVAHILNYKGPSIKCAVYWKNVTLKSKLY